MNNAELILDLDAYRQNLVVMRELAPNSQQMAIVKANAYGHGVAPCARAAREIGAEWLGVATPHEAFALRALGDTGPILCWLATPGAPFRELAEANIDVTASSSAQLQEIMAADIQVRVHLKVDTGLNRNGAPESEWVDFFERAAIAQNHGKIHVVGLWTHFANADEPNHPANDLQEQRFDQAVAMAAEYGISPEWCHLANSAAAATRPSAQRDLVRIGIASYGINPDPQVKIDGLVPSLTARAALARVKSIQPGDSVSYGWRWTATEPTTLGLVPVGYGDGIPRAASNRAEVRISGTRAPIRGTVCMDQFMIDLGDVPAKAGDWVTLFGSGESGEPTAEDWAQALDTIGYEIVTRLSGRWTRAVRGER
ncbi:MAG: alanine racemase [Aeromicrobium sp.]|nr:MAG: alanine racemase [Aeromicrobium sp.]